MSSRSELEAEGCVTIGLDDRTQCAAEGPVQDVSCRVKRTADIICRLFDTFFSAPVACPKKSGWRNLGIAGLIVICFYAEAQADDTKRILLVQPYHNRFPAAAVIAEALTERVQSAAPGKVEVYEDFLDMVRFPSEAHLAQSASFLAQKYSGRRLDLLVAMGPDSLGYIAKYGSMIAPGAVIIFCGVTEETAKGLPDNVKGVVSDLSAIKTLELARQLQPTARKVVVITGIADIDRNWERKVREQFSVHQKTLEFTYLVGTPLPLLLKTVAELPRDTIIIMLSFFRDTTGRPFVPRDVVAEVTKISPAPVYAPYDTYLASGIVGGFMDTFAAVGRTTADLALAILAGRDTERFVRPPSEFVVDAPALEHWGLSQQRLPAGATILHKRPSLWEEHRDTVIAASAIVILQSLFIAALLIERHRRRHAEDSLQQSEHRVAVTENRLISVEQEYKSTLSELGERLLALQEEERRRIASELHDSTAQHLVAADLTFMRIVSLTKQTAKLKALFEQAQASIDAAQKELRIFTYLLYPADLQKDGLKAVIERFVEGFGRRTDLATVAQLDGELDTLPYAIQRAALRIVQEALSNVRRHANATKVTVKLSSENDLLTIHIRDNGEGIKGGQETEGRMHFGVGIPGMQARVRGFGGNLRILSGARGTSVIATIPLLATGSDAVARAEPPKADDTALREGEVPIVHVSLQPTPAMEAATGTR